jgi:hypothetical protein
MDGHKLASSLPLHTTMSFVLGAPWCARLPLALRNQVCVCVRERERERECVRACVRACVSYINPTYTLNPKIGEQNAAVSK